MLCPQCKFSYDGRFSCPECGYNSKKKDRKLSLRDELEKSLHELEADIPIKGSYKELDERLDGRIHGLEKSLKDLQLSLDKLIPKKFDFVGTPRSQHGRASSTPIHIHRAPVSTAATSTSTAVSGDSSDSWRDSVSVNSGS